MDMLIQDINQLEDNIMGELIKKVGKIHIRDTEFDVELNEAEYPGLDKVIHIQNEKFRLLFTQKEFIQFSTVVLEAKDNFDYYKGKGIL